MPAAAAYAVTGYSTLTAAFAASAAAAFTYAAPLAVLEDCPLDPPKALTMEELCRDILHVGARLDFEQLDGFDNTARLIGPILAVGHCMGEGYPPGTVCFADPTLAIRAGDEVLCSNGASPIQGRVHAVKIIDFLAGSWCLRGADGVAPVSIASAISVLGRVVLKLKLPDRCRAARYAREETAKFEAKIPQDFLARTNAASDELAARTALDRREYPQRLLVGTLFWKNLHRMGLPITDPGLLTRLRE